MLNHCTEARCRISPNIFHTFVVHDKNTCSLIKPESLPRNWSLDYCASSRSSRDILWSEVWFVFDMHEDWILWIGCGMWRFLSKENWLEIMNSYLIKLSKITFQSLLALRKSLGPPFFFFFFIITSHQNFNISLCGTFGTTNLICRKGEKK